MPLSRYLYMIDEVIYSFIEALLKQKDLNECYYWISEYYYSGFKRKSCHILWKIYYDFYAIKYPKLETLINNELKLWNSTENIAFILNVVAYLFDCRACCDVFLAHQSLHEGKSFRGRPPRWLKDFDPSYKKLLLCIHTCRYNQLMFYIRDIPSQKLYELVRQYFSKVKQLYLHPKTLESISYRNKHHVILALILHLQLPEEAITLENDPIQVPSEIVEGIVQFNQDSIDPIYQTLLHKRSYTISDSIGCFQLARFHTSCPQMKKLLGFHWEWFASFSPLWRKRFNKYNAKRDRKTKKMLFNNDDNLEEFSEKYDYEPDEQSNEVQGKSILDIQKRTPREWIKDIFEVDYDRDKLFEDYLEKKD